MKYQIERVEKRAGPGTLRVFVHQGGEGVNGIPLTLHAGQWISPFNQPQAGTTGDKDPQGEPGVVELVGVQSGLYLVGLEVQPDQVVYIPLNMLLPGFQILVVDLIAPYERRLAVPDAAEDPDDATLTIQDTPP